MKVPDHSKVPLVSSLKAGEGLGGDFRGRQAISRKLSIDIDITDIDLHLLVKS